MKGLTKKQREIVDFIQAFITNNRYAPTFREVATQFNYKSMGTVHKHIESLKAKGVLTKEEGVSRSLSLAKELETKSSLPEVAVPLVGEIGGPSPIRTYSTTRTLGIPSSMVVHPDGTYALLVHGQAFTDELLSDGDVLIVEARQEANPGETVLALINGTELIVKKYYPDGKNVKLVGAQIHHTPLIVNPKNLAIHGVVIGMLRDYG